jgi:predicted PurR-regulated permease PerM
MPTPIVISPRTRTIILLAIAAGVILLWRAAPTAVTILLGGLTLAVFLSFPVNMLSRIMPRGFAVLCAFIGLLIIGILVAAIVIPLLIQQLTALTDSAPVSRVQLILEAILNNLISVLSNVAVILFQLSIMVFIATYLLANITEVQSAIVAMAPTRYRPDVRQLLTNIGRSISRYLAGLLRSR